MPSVTRRARDSRHTHGVARVQTNIFESSSLLTKSKVIRRRQIRVLQMNAGRRAPDSHPPFGVGIRQGLQKHAFRKTEHDGVRCYARYQRDQGMTVNIGAWASLRTT